VRTFVRSKSKGMTVDVVVLYADLRGFSTWSNSARAKHVAELVATIYGRVIQLVGDYHHNFHKLLGDGFLLVWEINEFKDYDASKCHPAGGALSEALGAAFEIHKKYYYLRKDLPYPSPDGFGIGIAVGKAFRVAPFTWVKKFNEEDYVGYPMNAGARLQSLANSYGVVLDGQGSAICAKCRVEILRSNDHPSMRLNLMSPSSRAKQKAAALKGLAIQDRSQFNYVTWPHLQNTLWKTDGSIR
jgi:class 3 adenylate cyclase